MADETTTAQRIEVVREYFRRADAGDPALLDLYTDDVELFFPKFGLGRGKQDMAEFARRLWAGLEWLAHDIDSLHILVAGDHIVVEGTERGRTRSGQEWPDGTISTGRFCDVFAFDGLLISRVHIYVDPDFTNDHRARVEQLSRRHADPEPPLAGEG